jgi:menaquinol-cytochrome c reductase iron-sulfur subunit
MLLDEKMEKSEQITRNNFISLAIWAIGGLISLGMGIPAIAFIIGPALNRTQAQEWIRLGPISKIELNIPTLFKFKVQRKTGWITNEEEVSVYVLTNNGRDFIAMSNICTHLGCRVRWISDQEIFFCPCHNGVFDNQGAVVSGPPPRPLDQYEVKVEDDQLFILGG